MFLPPATREAVFAIIALNCELSKALVLPVSASVTGPMAGLIRLQWWRDVVENPNVGRQARHDVAIALADLLESGRIAPSSLLTLIDAREAELCRLPDWTAWRKAMRDGAGEMQRIVGHLLGIQDKTLLDAVSQAGAAFGVGSLIRHLPQVLLSGRMPLPEEALQDAGLPHDSDGVALLNDDRLGALLKRLSIEGEAFLPDRSLIRRARLATLPVVLAMRDLKRGPVGPDTPGRGSGDRLAVMISGLRGR
ncbi:hypothetical protein GOB81_04430 [Acetobacter sp. LMG 1627]|uniref:Phytoene synthase n=2 Tax=Acetobacter conturbans TaxID=1737472 RepID=A0ABX0JZM4_9PROT|nr:hypothetical protein [Acetobacter conturbans]